MKIKSTPITAKAKRRDSQSCSLAGPLKQTKDKSWGNIIGHGVLDVAGLVPGFGEIADGINAGWYAAEGDYKNAALSAAAMIPFAGWGATATKVGLKFAPKTTKVVKSGTNAIKKSKLGDTKVGRFVAKESGEFLDKPTRYMRKWRGTDQAMNKVFPDNDSGTGSSKTNRAKIKPTELKTKATNPKKSNTGGSGSWAKAAANNKSGTSLTNLVKQRNSAKKGSAEYAKAQNAINKAYGVKKRY